MAKPIYLVAVHSQLLAPGYYFFTPPIVDCRYWKPDLYLLLHVSSMQY